MAMPVDKNGFPILLAQAPGQVADQGVPSGASVQRDTQHGNPWFDPKTGRFSNGPANMKIVAGGQLFEKLINVSRQLIQRNIEMTKADQIALYQVGNSIKVVLLVNGSPRASFQVPSEDTPEDEFNVAELEGQAGLGDPTGPKNRSDLPDGIDELQWERRLDAVRDLARTSDTLEPEDVKQWLEDRAKEISSIDIDQFIRDVRAHRLDDLADAINTNQMTAQEKRGQVRVAAPQKWINDNMQGLEDHEILKLANRLQARGWSDEDLKSKVLAKIKDESRRTDLEQKLGEEPQIPEPAPVQLEDLQIAETTEESQWQKDVQQFFMDAMKSMPPPQVNVEVPVTVERGTTNRKVIRDERGYISEIVESNDSSD